MFSPLGQLVSGERRGGASKEALPPRPRSLVIGNGVVPGLQQVGLMLSLCCTWRWGMKKAPPPRLRSLVIGNDVVPGLQQVGLMLWLYYISGGASKQAPPLHLNL